MPKFPDYDLYAELGVSENANKNDIIKAWRELLKTLHPDKQQTEAGKTKATAKSTRLNEAKAILLDPEQREEYDEHRAKQKSGGSGTSSGGARRGDFFDEPTSFATPGSFGGFTGATGGGQSSFSSMNNDDLFDHPGASHNPFGRGAFSGSGSGSGAGTPKAGGATRQESKSSWTNEAPYVDPRASCNPHTGPTSPLSGSTFQSANAFGGGSYASPSPSSFQSGGGGGGGGGGGYFVPKSPMGGGGAGFGAGPKRAGTWGGPQRSTASSPYSSAGGGFNGGFGGGGGGGFSGARHASLFDDDDGGISYPMGSGPGLGDFSASRGGSGGLFGGGGYGGGGSSRRTGYPRSRGYEDSHSSGGRGLLGGDGVGRW